MIALFFYFFDIKRRLEEEVKHNTEASQRMIDALSSHGSKLKKLRIKPKKSLQ